MGKKNKNVAAVANMNMRRNRMDVVAAVSTNMRREA